MSLAGLEFYVAETAALTLRMCGGLRSAGTVEHCFRSPLLGIRALLGLEHLFDEELLQSLVRQVDAEPGSPEDEKPLCGCTFEQLQR